MISFVIPPRFLAIKKLDAGSNSFHGADPNVAVVPEDYRYEAFYHFYMGLGPNLRSAFEQPYVAEMAIKTNTAW